MTEIRYQTYNVPIADTCTVCGINFTPGDHVTLSPPMHRSCDTLGTYIDNALAAGLAAISAQLDDDWDAYHAHRHHAPE